MQKFFYDQSMVGISGAMFKASGNLKESFGVLLQVCKTDFCKLLLTFYCVPKGIYTVYRFCSLHGEARGLKQGCEKTAKHILIKYISI